MKEQNKLVIFWIDKQQFALYLNNVERIVRIVDVKPIPNTPDFLLGTINFHGVFLPVVNIRKLFELPKKRVELKDQLIITNTPARRVALWVDDVCDVFERSDKEMINADKVMINNKYVEGVFKSNDEIVILHDLDKFLKSKESEFLKLKPKHKNIKTETHA